MRPSLPSTHELYDVSIIIPEEFGMFNQTKMQQLIDAGCNNKDIENAAGYELALKNFYNFALKNHKKAMIALKKAVDAYQNAEHKVREVTREVTNIEKELSDVCDLKVLTQTDCKIDNDFGSLNTAEIVTLSNLEKVINHLKEKLKSANLELAFHQNIVDNHFNEEQLEATKRKKEFNHASQSYKHFVMHCKKHSYSLSLSKNGMEELIEEFPEYERLYINYHKNI